MAEVATILGLANAGFKLSITLFSFAEAVRTVDKEILRTAKDISLFSQVLKLLAVTLERGHESKCISATAFKTSAQIVEECKSLFDELEAVIAKSTSTKKLVRMGQDDMVASDTDKVIVPFAQRLLYFFRKGKMDTLRRQLESLKTSLQVMLSVLNFAEIVTAQKNEERLEMESLILANEAAVAELRKHEKADEKDFKTWFSKPGASDPADSALNPSIASTGIVREIVQQHSGQNSNTGVTGPADKTTNNEVSAMQSMLPVPMVFNNLEPKIDDSNGKLEASVQDRADVINHLLALWSPNVSTALRIEKTTTSGQERDSPETKKEAVKEEEDEEAEEIVELFPTRSRPY